MKAKIKIEDLSTRKKNIKHLNNLRFNANENGNLIEFDSKPIKYLDLFEIASIGNPCKDFTYKSIISEEGFSIASKTKEQIIKKIESDELQLKDFFEFVGRAITFFNNEDLPELISKVIAPAFQKRFPKGSIHLLQIDDLLVSRESYARLIMASKELPELFNISSKEDFKGLQSMRALQSVLAPGTINTYLSFILLGFRPNSYGTFVAKVSGFFIFLFGEPLELREPYPPTFISHYIPNNFIDFYNRSADDDTYKLFEETRWTEEQYKKLFYIYVERANNLLDYFYDISNFTNSDGFVDGLKAFNSFYTINRIVAESVLILTEHQTPLRSIPFSFAVLDKIANLIKLSKPSLDEVEIFKNLVCKEEISKMYDLFNEYPEPFNNYFRNKFKQAFNNFNTKVVDSIFLKERISDDKIILDHLNPANNITKNQYIQELTRALRNTHHGYGIKADQLKKLIISNCSIGREIEFITYFLVLMLIAEPREFIAHW